MLILNIIAAILLGTGGTAPVVTRGTCTVSSGFSKGQNVIQTHGTSACNFSATCGGIACTGIDAITSWAIVTQSCASRYSITAEGILQGGANAANVTNETDTVTVTATNSTGTSPAVVQTVVAYADGSPAAPSSAPQYPTLLSGSGYSRQSYSATPPWNVAGVDYAVGYPTGTTLKDWQSICTPSCPSGVSVNNGNNTVSVSGNNVTLNAIDFSLHGGAGIIVSGNNDTITNSKMLYGATMASNGNFAILNQTGGSNLTLSYNIMDGNGAVLGTGASGQSSLIAVGGGVSGTLTMEYNRFTNYVQHVIEYNSGQTAPSVVYNYNLVDNGGSAFAGPHLNYLQFGTNGNSTSATVDFNTTYQPVTPKAGGEGFQAYSNGTGSVHGNFSYNTMLYGPGGEGRLHLVGSSTSVVTVTATANYIDKRGGSSWTRVYGGRCIGDVCTDSFGDTLTYVNNINPIMGSVIQPQ
jgi:hypothetical protein